MWALRSRFKKIYLGVFIVTCIIFLFYITGNKDGSHKVTKNIKKLVKHKFKSWITENKQFNRSIPILQPVFHSLTKKIDSNAELLVILAQEAKCPACFGVEVCEEISTAYIKLLHSDPIAVYNDFMVFPGNLGGVQKVSLVVPRPDVLGNFDQLVCPNAKAIQWPAKCRSLLEAENPFLLTPKQSVDDQSIISMRDKLALTPPFIVPLTCKSVKLKDLFVKTFDTNDDRSLDMEEKNIFHTTLTLMPHLVNLKALSTIGMINTFPRVVGSCGRVLVTKGEMNPLSLMLSEPFSQRAAIAVQLINLMQEFLENDVWIFFQSSWRIENLHVNEKGEAFLTSLSDMYLIEKISEEESKPCNWECVHNLRIRLQSGKNSCFNQDEAMHLMYSEMCLHVFSNMKQHKFNDYFEREASARIEYRSWPGLLHHIPSKDRGEVEKLIATCVDEVKDGERLEALEDLQDILSDIVEASFDEKDEADDEDENSKQKIET